MSTLLVTTQIVAYGVGIVSASLNIAVLMRRHMRRRRLLAQRASGGHSLRLPHKRSGDA